MSVAGKGLLEGYLSPVEMAAVAGEGLARLKLDGRRVLVLIPDGTRTMPMPVMFEILERELGPRVAALDYLVALGTHSPMDDAQLEALVGRPVVGGRAGARRIFNHRWDDPATFVELGTIPANVVEEVTGGRLSRTVPVALNRLATEYDHVLICGPVFPHEVVGFSGGTKYLFPGIAAPEIIHFTHWLGALITSFGSDRHDRHAGARGHRQRRCDVADAALAARAGRDPRRRRRGCSAAIRTRPGARRRRFPAAPRACAWTEPFDRVLAVMPRCTTTCGRRQGRVQDRAGRRRWRRGHHLRAAHHRGELRPRRSSSTRSAITAAITSWRSGTDSPITRGGSWRIRPT